MDKAIPGDFVADLAHDTEAEASEQKGENPLEATTQGTSQKLPVLTSGKTATLNLWPEDKAVGESVWPRSANLRPLDFTPKQTSFCIPRPSCLFRQGGA